MKRIADILTGHAPALIILTAVIAYFIPSMFAWVQQGDTSSIILGIIMLTMGLTLTTEDFRILFSRPLDILIGSVAQYTIMPLLAFTLSRIFNLPDYLAIGVILVGCCPGGVSSNIMSYLCKGDVAFSVGMTAMSTILSPILTPLLILLYVGESIDVDAWGMFKGILFITLLPVTLGFAINYICKEYKVYRTIREVMPSVSVICLAFIVGGVIYTVKPQLETSGISLFLLMLAIVFLHNGLGYVAGFLLGSLLHFSTAKKRTLSIEIGMQNAGMATVLANNYFANAAMVASNPAAVLCVIPCALSCAYHSISGTILANLFVRYDNRTR